MTAKRTATKPRQASKRTGQGRQRNGRKAAEPRSKRQSQSAGALPSITSVEILYSENGAVPLRTFDSLWDADRALATAFGQEPPPAGGGYDKTGFVVRWSDGWSHEGRVDVSAQELAAAQGHGGLLRRHLTGVSNRYVSDHFARTWAAHKRSDEIAELQAWGRELASRLARDLAGQLAKKSRRNARRAP